MNWHELSSWFGSQDFWIAARLVAAGILGSLIGLEREVRHRQAGLRTHAILCIGSALITVISITMAGDDPHADKTRIAAQIVSGIGFLGGGAIIRMGTSIIGLTTAASLWTTAGIGMAAGSGHYFAAILTTGFMLLVLRTFHWIETSFLQSHLGSTVVVVFEGGMAKMERIFEAIQRHQVRVDRITTTRLPKDRLIEMTVEMRPPGNIAVQTILEDLSKLEEVEEVRVL